MHAGSVDKGVSQREIPMGVTNNHVRRVGLVIATILAGAVGGCSYYGSAVPPNESAVPSSEQTAMAPPSPGPCAYGESAMYCYGNPAQPYYATPGGGY
jgi:hypothetical protein